MDAEAQRVLREACRQHVDSMVDVLVSIAQTQKVRASVRMQAAAKVIDYFARGGAPSEAEVADLEAGSVTNNTYQVLVLKAEDVEGASADLAARLQAHKRALRGDG